MTERERLINLIHMGIEYARGQMNDEGVDFAYGDVADHLLANGVIVPPCKVGDKLYAISDSRIAECTCYDMMLSHELTICADFHCDYDCDGCPFSSWGQDYSGEYSCQGEYGDWFFSLSNFGKTVFLTKEEALKALKERSEVDES